MSSNKNNLIDLHVHSCHSDGELSPNELIELALKKNIGTIAITDHDTILGLKNVNYNENINLIKGIELSAKYDNGSMHILGYNIDINNFELNKKLDALKDDNIDYVLFIIDQIKKDYNIIFDNNDINTLIGANHSIGRPDIAKLCIKYGYVKSVPEAFDKYLVEANKKGLTYEECINLIINSGGIPVLAHPKTLKLNEKNLLIQIKELIRCGLQGIEVYHSTHSFDERNLYLKIAEKHDLLISGGTDFHGPTIKPDIELGTGINNNIKIKNLSILSKIKNQSNL